MKKLIILLIFLIAANSSFAKGHSSGSHSSKGHYSKHSAPKYHFNMGSKAKGAGHPVIH